MAPRESESTQGSLVSNAMESSAISLKPYRWFVVFAWIGINLLGFFYGLKLFDETTTTFEAPEHSDATKATDAMNEYFPSQAGISWASVYIKSNSDSVLEGPLATSLAQFSRDLLNATARTDGFYSMTSYYFFDALDLPLFAQQYTSSTTDQATFITVGYQGGDDQLATDFCKTLRDNVNSIATQYDLTSDATFQETGEQFFEMDSLEGVKKDSAVMDQYVGPAAFFVLAVVIQNAPVMIVPLLCIVSSIMLQFLIMYFVAQKLDVIAFVPSLMLSLTFATSIDYSLFMLARFCEEQRMGRSVDASIVLMLRSAGLTILMSGATLMVCFLGLCFFSMEMLQTTGVGAASTLFAVLLSTLTLMPALLYCMGDYIMWAHSYVNMEHLPIFGHKSPDYLGPCCDYISRTFCCCCGCVRSKHLGSQSDGTDNYLDGFDHGGDLLGEPHMFSQGHPSTSSFGTLGTAATEGEGEEEGRRNSRQNTKDSTGTGAGAQLYSPDRRAGRKPSRSGVRKAGAGAGMRSGRSDEEDEILLALGTSVLSDPGAVLGGADNVMHTGTTGAGAGAGAGVSPGRGVRASSGGYARVPGSGVGDSSDYFHYVDKGSTDGTEADDILDEDGQSLRQIRQTMWYRIGSFLLIKWQGVVACIAIIALLLPFMIYCLSVKEDVNFIYMTPKDSVSAEAYNGMSEDFGPGYTVPYRVLYQSSDTSSPSTANLYSDEGFQRVQGATQYLVDNLPYTSVGSFFGAYMIDGGYVSYAEMSDAVAKNVTTANSTETTYKLMYGEFFSAKNTTVHEVTYAFLYLDVNPYSVSGTNWLKSARELTGYIKDQYQINVMFTDGASVPYDAVEAVYEEFPMMIGITLTLVFLLMATAFKSISAPLRLILTIVLTLAFCYGFAVLTYQHGLLSWMEVDAVAQYGSINWLPPVMCFTIIVGLSLDYDVFLISRILEYREAGYTSDGSILKGVYKTGYIITDAGIIMAVAFSGLFLSNEVVLNQTAFLLVVAVLLDTFIIRTVLVPILMGLSGKSAWWPREIKQVPIEEQNSFGFKDTETKKVVRWLRSTICCENDS